MQHCGNESVSVFRWWEGDTYFFGSIRKSYPQSLNLRPLWKRSSCKTFCYCLGSNNYWIMNTVTKCVLICWIYLQWQGAVVMMIVTLLKLASVASVRAHANVDWMLFVKCYITKQYANVCQDTMEFQLQDAKVKLLHISLWKSNIRGQFHGRQLYYY
jgi:hypothetical protein